jgi:hypothetical protein
VPEPEVGEGEGEEEFVPADESLKAVVLIKPAKQKPEVVEDDDGNVIE